MARPPSLKTLLPLLQQYGVSKYVTPGLTIELSAPAPQTEAVETPAADLGDPRFLLEKLTPRRKFERANFRPKPSDAETPDDFVA
jgi:hypothetical protein